MKLLLCTFGLLVVTSTAATAEETIRKEGDKSINFSVSRVDLQAYKFGFGGKYWTSSDIAYSASLDASNTKSESNDTIGGESQSKSDQSFYALSVAREKHLQTSSKLSPYFGGELKYSRYSYVNTHKYTYSSVNDHNRSFGKQYAVAVLAGAEYALNKSISLSGEYSYGFAYGINKYESEWSNEMSRSKGFDLSVGRLTLLLYF